MVLKLESATHGTIGIFITGRKMSGWIHRSVMSVLSTPAFDQPIVWTWCMKIRWGWDLRETLPELEFGRDAPLITCVAVKGPLVHENYQNNYLKDMDQQAQYYCRAYMHMVRKTWSYFHMEGSFLEISLDLWQKSKRVKLPETCSGK